MFIQIDGHRLNAVSFGSGPVDLVAHGGWVGSWELWQDPFMLMQERWRCVSYDHRGSGASTFPADTITPEALVDDLFGVLDHFSVERCVLAGESLGALTCLQAVLREPQRFAGLMLVDGVPAADGERQRTLVAGSRADFPATSSGRCRSVVGMCANCFSKLEVVVGQVIGASVLLKRPAQDFLADLGLVAPYDELGELAHTVSFLRSLDLDAVEILGQEAVDTAATWTTAPQRKPFAFGWLVPRPARRRRFA